MNKVFEKIRDSKVVAVLEIDSLENIIPLCNALLNGGVNVVEIALRTNVSQEATEIIIKNFPEILVGLGTVINEDQVKFAIDSGVSFALSPGCNPKILDLALKNNLCFCPGISCPSDIEISVDYGCEVLKFFPAQNNGGIEYLKSINSPYKHLNLKYIPLGGINISNVKDYLNSDLVLAVGGSWLASKELINSNKWNTITKNSKEISELIL
mgnify:FL=1